MRARRTEDPPGSLWQVNVAEVVPLLIGTVVEAAELYCHKTPVEKPVRADHKATKGRSLVILIVPVRGLAVANQRTGQGECDGGFSVKCPG